MTQLIETLLRPISADSPCGPDLSSDPRFYELEALVKGKPEVEHGAVKRPAEPPDWAAVKSGTADYLAVSKHLRPAIMLCCSLLNLEGLAGFAEGLEFVRQLVEGHWATVHPLLDPTDGNDPQQRLSILSSLIKPRGGLSPLTQEWLAIIDYLYLTPLCRPKGVPPVTLDIVDSVLAAKNSAATGGLDAATLAAQIQSCRSEEIVAHHSAVKQAHESLRAVDDFLGNTLGATQSMAFDPLDEVLVRIEQTLAPYTSASALVQPAAAKVAPGAQPEPPLQATVMTTSTVNGRQDVIRLLDNLCEYYSRYEPGSPVPYLLRRAQKLAAMNFVDAMLELQLANVEQLRPSMGSAVGGGTPPAS
jgi:type VI secretion system protein ImpA